MASVVVFRWLFGDGRRLHSTLCQWQLTIAKSDCRASTDARTGPRPLGAPLPGVEELPFDGRTDGGPSCHNRALPQNPASDLRSDLLVCLAGGLGTPFAASVDASDCGHSRRSYPDVVRRNYVDEILSRIHSIRGRNQADDSRRILALHRAAETS